MIISVLTSYFENFLCWRILVQSFACFCTLFFKLQTRSELTLIVIGFHAISINYVAEFRFALCWSFITVVSSFHFLKIIVSEK